MLLYYQEGLLSTLCSYLLNKSLFTGVLLGFFCSIIQQHNTLESVLTYSAFFMNTVLIASMISFLMSSHIPQAMLSFLSILLICPFLFILLSYMNNQARWTECYFLWGSWMILFPISVVLIQSLLSISFEYFE
jgi:hypothetical protein